MIVFFFFFFFLGGGGGGGGHKHINVVAFISKNIHLSVTIYTLSHSFTPLLIELHNYMVVSLLYTKPVMMMVLVILDGGMEH